MAQKTSSGASDAPQAANAADKPKKSMMPVIMIVVALLAVAIGAFGAKAVLGKGHAASAKSEAVKVGETVPLDEFLLNLNDPTNDHYVKATIALGLKEGVSAEKFKDKTPESRDAIVMVLSSKSLDDLRSASGKTVLKKQIMDAVNAAIGEKDVAAVYFEDFATQ